MKTVLVADDEVNIRRLYLQELKEEGYNVVLASNGQEALQQARESSPDLVIMDIRMPGMDGIETMGRMLEENNEIPIILNTAYSSYKESFQSWSADAYLTKSADLTELKETVHSLLENRPHNGGNTPSAGASA